MDGFHAHSGWFSIVSSVSSRGETAGTFRLATDFHGEASA